MQPKFGVNHTIVIEFGPMLAHCFGPQRAKFGGTGQVQDEFVPEMVKKLKTVSNVIADNGALSPEAPAP